MLFNFMKSVYIFDMIEKVVNKVDREKEAKDSIEGHETPVFLLKLMLKI